MIKEVIDKILEKLQAANELQGIFWHYGEPIEFRRADQGEGYVTLVPLEKQTVEPLMRGDRHHLRLFIVLVYRHVDEKTCDEWIHEKTEEIWKILKANENWDGLVSVSSLENYTFVPSVETDYTFDKMFNQLYCRVEKYPES